MLARELARPPVRRVEPRLAVWLPPAEADRLAACPAGAAQLRAQCLLRADADVPRPALTAHSQENRAPVAPPAPREDLEQAVAALRERSRLLASPEGAVEVLLFQGKEAPLLLRELGRCREITFRAAGQGTGLGCDVAAEDDYYHHLVLWDRAAGEIVGAYRLGFVREILAEHGPSGLYLDHIFRFKPEFHRAMEGAIELSRSFVLPSRQRDNQALALLWRGLGAVAQRHQRSVLFGSVTISNAHHPATRAILVEHLRRNYADDPALRRLVEPRRPFHPATTYHSLIGEAYAGEPLEELSPLVRRLEAGQRGIPPLMRYYCALGARYLGFHVEPSFQDALYCLLRVDLASIPSGYRRKFMGDNPAPARP